MKLVSSFFKHKIQIAQNKINSYQLYFDLKGVDLRRLPDLQIGWAQL